MIGRAPSAVVVVALWVLGACASNEPIVTLPGGEPSIVIDVAGDGFVRVGERRVPLEAIVLELRQRARAMTAEERARFVVQLRVDPQPRGSEAERVASRGRDRLVTEIDIMEFGVVRL